MYQKIHEAIKVAMKAKDTDKKDVLKMAVTKAQAIAKEQKCEVTDEIRLEGIQKELKQLNQTKDSLANCQDSDLYKSTMNKIAVLNEYLPKMMDEDEVMQAVRDILFRSTMDLKNLNKGAAMKLVMPQLKGKAENKTIAKCVDVVLGEKG